MLKRRLREATVKALSIEEVLAEEADAIHGTDWRREKGLTGRLPNQDEHHERAWLNADRKYIEAAKNSRSDTERSDIGFASGTETVTEKVAPRKELYRALNKLNRAALCCSGGGIRSATFCLGVIQALAAYDVTRVRRHHRRTPRRRQPARQPLTIRQPQILSLLRQSRQSPQRLEKR